VIQRGNGYVRQGVVHRPVLVLERARGWVGVLRIGVCLVRAALRPVIDIGVRNFVLGRRLGGARAHIVHNEGLQLPGLSVGLGSVGVVLGGHGSVLVCSCVRSCLLVFGQNLGANGHEAAI